MKESILREYAKLAVCIGANVQKGQPISIRGSVEAYEFIRMCVEEAYKAGASQVFVQHEDNVLTRLAYENVETEILKEVPLWSIEKTKYQIEKKTCMLNIISPDPDLLKGIDPSKISKVQRAMMKASQPYQYYTMNNVGQWAIVAYPNAVWAKKVFPEMEEQEAIDALWDAILSCSRVKEGEDAIQAWENHNAEIKKHSKKLNEFNFKSLHFKNGKGTDLTVGLIKDHVWEGGADKAANGAMFNPNIPTEEVFTMPDRYHIDGVVYSTKPLSYNGQLIEDFKLVFKEGKVIDFDARVNKEVLGNLLNTDDGAKSLGEVALISHDSPISNSGILFYNTLFDENASCHLALGRCYPTNLKGGVDLSEEELLEKGGNQSMVHVDFMFGSEDMNVVGTTYDGQEVSVFQDGNFVI